MRLIATPPRGRRREHGRGLRQAHRPPRDLPGHPRARRHPRERRRPHRVPGLDADAAARRPGPRGHARARGIPGARLPRRCSGPMAKWVDRRSTRPRGSPSSLARAFDVASLGPAGPGRRSRCPRTCCATRPTSPDAAPYRRVAGGAGRARTSSARSELLPARERPLIDRRRGRLDRAGRRATCSPSPRPPASRSPRRSAARTTSTTARRSTPGTLGARHATRARAARPRGGRAARARRPAGRHPDAAATRCSTPAPAPAPVHVHPDPDELGARLPARARDRLRPRRVRRRAAPASSRRAAGATDERGARRLRARTCASPELPGALAARPT